MIHFLNERIKVIKYDSLGGIYEIKSRNIYFQITFIKKNHKIENLDSVVNKKQKSIKI